MYFTDVQSEAIIQRLDHSFLAIDCRFMNFCQLPISEVSDQSISTLETPDEPNGRDAWGLIFRKLRREKRESHKKMIYGEPFVVIGKMVILVTMSTFCAIGWKYLN